MVSSTIPFPISNSPPNPKSPPHSYNRQSLSTHFSNTPVKAPKPAHFNGDPQTPPQAHISPTPNSKNPTIRSRISQLCQEGRPDLARRLFDAIPRHTTVLWNTIIIGFICNGMPDEALQFYGRMRNTRDTKCDSYTYSSALKACAETQKLKAGKAVHCQILRSHGNPSRIVYNSLLNMYSNCLSLSFEMLEDDPPSGALEFLRSDYVQNVFDRMRKRNVVAWNIMIAWYVRTQRFVDALKQFKLMLVMGINPTVISFVNVFPSVVGIRDRKNANILYGLLLKLGSDYVHDLYAVSSAINMYSELGCMDSARQVFDCSTERNTEVWNTMIGGYVQNDYLIEGLGLFLHGLEVGQIVPDNVTLLTAITAVSLLQQLELGEQLHAYVIKNSMVSYVTISNSLIVMYSRCDSVEVAFSVFDKMVDRDIVSWNTMISAFVQNGFDDEGLMLVFGMQKQGFVIDCITATALLSAASNLRNQELGKQTHAYLFRHKILFEGMDSYLIDMYAKSGLIDAAQRLFVKNSVHDRDEVTWNSMISGYTQNGQIEQAFAVFRQLVDHNEIPNAVTLASILPACSQLGGISLGKQLHGFAFRHGLCQNVFVSTALVDMYSKCGAINYAESVFVKIADKNSVTYTTMILGFGQHGLGETALSLFQLMQRSGMQPDAITFVAVLSACSYGGLVNEGLKVFDSMERDYGIAPTVEHFCCVVDMLGRAGRVIEAYNFAKELGEEGNVLGIWGSLLAACRIHKEYELGKLVAKRLLEMEKGISNMSGYQVLVSNIYAEEGSWENVDRVRKGMQEKGLQKEVGCSWIDITGALNCFKSRDQEHPQCDEIYAKLDELSMEMKAAGYRPNISCRTGVMREYDD